MKRLLALVAMLAFALAACGEPSSNPDAMLLSYTLAAGDEFQYEVVLDQHIEMNASGDAAMLAGEDVPGEAAVDIAGTATFTHAISDGPEAGTFEVHITGEFTDVSVTGTVDGESVDSSDIPDFAAMEPIDETVVVDEQGNIIHEGGDIEDPLSGLLGGLGALGGGANPAPGLDPGQFIGPPLPDEEVAVGDSWSDEIETTSPGEDPIVTSINSTVTGVEQLDGAEVLVIDSNATTSLIEVDLAEFFAGMIGGMGPERASTEETADIDAMLDQLQFLISVDDSTADSTTWFDAQAGLARQSETTAGSSISMDMNIPDEKTGEMAGFVMDMALDQDVTYRLISGPTG